MSKQISFVWKTWMTLGALCGVLFNGSYFMATTMPDCANCGTGSASAMQIFHGLFMGLFAIGSVVTFIATTVSYFDEK